MKSVDGWRKLADCWKGCRTHWSWSLGNNRNSWMRWSEGVVQLKTPAADRCCFVALTRNRE